MRKADPCWLSVKEMTDKQKYLNKLGFKLKLIRTEQELSQAKLAAILSRSIASINKIESGKVNLGIYTLTQYCKVLRISVSDLLKGLE